MITLNVTLNSHSVDGYFIESIYNHSLVLNNINYYLLFKLIEYPVLLFLRSFLKKNSKIVVGKILNGSLIKTLRTSSLKLINPLE